MGINLLIKLINYFFDILTLTLLHTNVSFLSGHQMARTSCLEQQVGRSMFMIPKETTV